MRPEASAGSRSATPEGEAGLAAERAPAPSAAPAAPGWRAPRPRAAWATAAAAALLSAGTLALYARVASYGFIRFDDNRYVTENPVVQAGLTWRGIAWAFTTLRASNWHPLTWLSHMLDVELFGMAPGAHHLVSAALHALNAALLFLALSRLTGARGRSLAVAALFAVHPLHVESVAWIAERKDVLSTLFGLLALLAYARHAERPSRGRFAAVAALFALSLLAKPMWVTLPFLLLLLDFWPLGRPAGAPARAPGLAAPPARTWRALALEKLPLLALAVASSAVTIVAQDRGGALSGLSLGLVPRLSNAAVAYVAYAARTLWPAALSIFYPYRAISAWEALAALGTIVAALGASLAAARRLPWLAVGLCWFLGTLVPVIGIVQVGGQAFADRYTYVPIVGLFVVAVWGVAGLASRWRPAPVALAAVVVGALGVATSRQLAHWSSHERLFRHALEVAPDNAVAHGALSEGLRAAGRREEALLHAREAVRLDPGSVRHWNNLGVSEREVGRLAEARAAFETALRLDPAHASSWVNVGLVDEDLSDPAAAETAYARATQLAPGEPDPWFRLGLLRSRAGRPLEAMRCYEETVARAPEHFGAWTNLAVLYQGAGRIAEAGAAFEAATRAEPGNFVGWRNLGVHLAKAGRPADAISSLRQALRLRPGDPDLARRLALADLSIGERQEPLAIAAQLDATDPRAAAEIRERAAALR